MTHHFKPLLLACFVLAAFSLPVFAQLPAEPSLDQIKAEKFIIQTLEKRLKVCTQEYDLEVRMCWEAAINCVKRQNLRVADETFAPTTGCPKVAPSHPSSSICLWMKSTGGSERRALLE